MKKFDEIIEHKNEFDEPSQKLIEEMSQRLSVLGDEEKDLLSMKKTKGWKIMEAKMREELRLLIIEFMFDEQVLDPRVIKGRQILAILKGSDIEAQRKELENIIDNLNV